MKKITLIGSTGLVGKEILNQFKLSNVSVFIPTREEKDKVLNMEHDQIIYCAGENQCNLEHIDNLIEVNSNYLSQIISKQNFNHLTYFSSTRVYGETPNTSEESTINLKLSDPRASFVTSKLLGESICKFSKKPILILRPSNIYGLTTTSKLFLPSITRHAVQDKLVNMYVDKDYSKDYINVVDVAKLTLEISSINYSGTVNLATGKNISAEYIANILESTTGCKIHWHTNNVTEKFHEIDTTKLRELVSNYKFQSLESSLKTLVDEFKKVLI